MIEYISSAEMLSFYAICLPACLSNIFRSLNIETW